MTIALVDTIVMPLERQLLDGVDGSGVDGVLQEGVFTPFDVNLKNIDLRVSKLTRSSAGVTAQAQGRVVFNVR